MIVHYRARGKDHQGLATGEKREVGEERRRGNGGRRGEVGREKREERRGDK